jgi:hypothetical protein
MCPVFHWRHCGSTHWFPNGSCAGAQVIFQEDNAGPHTEARYSSWMKDTFADLGWRIELQAPQGKILLALFITICTSNDYFFILSCRTGPYTNVLDLYIFPSMSHRHSALLQLYNNTEANKEQTWKTIQTVWKLERYFVFRGMSCICSCIPYHAPDHWGGWKQLLAVPWDSTLWCAPGFWQHSYWD